MSLIVLILVLSLFCYRVTRFIVEDTLIEGLRNKVLKALRRERTYLRDKLHDLITCPYCVSIWVSGLTIIVLDTCTSTSIPLPLIMWPALSAGGLVFWSIIED